MSKMNESIIEIIRFSAEDVMTASGGGLDVDPSFSDDSVGVIWLDLPSVINFNNFDPSEEGDLDYWADDGGYYFAYSGAYSKRYQVYSQTNNTDRLIGDVPEHLNTMAAGDAKKYQQILDWLNR